MIDIEVRPAIDDEPVDLSDPRIPGLLALALEELHFDHRSKAARRAIDEYGGLKVSWQDVYRWCAGAHFDRTDPSVRDSDARYWRD